MRHERNALVKMTDRLRRRGYACWMMRYGYGQYYRSIYLSDERRISAVGNRKWAVEEAEMMRVREMGGWGYEERPQWVFLGNMTTEELEAWLS